MRNFNELLKNQSAENKFVCIGLDSEYQKIPNFIREKRTETEAIVAFNEGIIDETADLVCAYKPNSAFYEALGTSGIAALKQTINYIHEVAEDVPVILDAKRGDIGNPNLGYADFAFKFLEADAITVHPYLGSEALQPFLSRKDKGVIVLCRTSNPGAGEFQGLITKNSGIGSDEPLYLLIARHAASRLFWNRNDNCGVVVGATYPKELQEVRRVAGNIPILIPGVGFQQKNVPLEEQVRQVIGAGKNSRDEGMIINSSRGIIFASSGADYAEVARKETLKLHNLINKYR